MVATDATTDTGTTKGGMTTDEGRDGTEGRHDSDGALVSDGHGEQGAAARGRAECVCTESGQAERRGACL